MKMKEIQRQELKTIRSTLTPEQVSFFSKKIQDKILMDRNYASAKNIMTYVSMRNEVDTKALIQTILNDGKICFVPVVCEDTLKIAQIDSMEQLLPARFGILEPRTDSYAALSDMDLILVPGLGFDKEGYRVGYGGGYYDRLLSDRTARNCLVGLCYEVSLVKKVEREPHDMRVDYVVTDERILTHG